MDVREAMLLTRAILTMLPHADSRWPGEQASNVVAHAAVAFGDVDKGFAEADVVVEHEFRQRGAPGLHRAQSATAMGTTTAS